MMPYLWEKYFSKRDKWDIYLLLDKFIVSRLVCGRRIKGILLNNFSSNGKKDILRKYLNYCDSSNEVMIL